MSVQGLRRGKLVSFNSRSRATFHLRTSKVCFGRFRDRGLGQCIVSGLISFLTMVITMVTLVISVTWYVSSDGFRHSSGSNSIVRF